MSISWTTTANKLAVNDVDSAKIGEAFKAAVLQLPVKVAASKAGVCESTVKNWRSGDTIPPLDTAIKLGRSARTVGDAIRAALDAGGPNARDTRSLLRHLEAIASTSRDPVTAMHAAAIVAEYQHLAQFAD